MSSGGYPPALPANPGARPMPGFSSVAGPRMLNAGDLTLGASSRRQHRLGNTRAGSARARVRLLPAPQARGLSLLRYVSGSQALASAVEALGGRCTAAGMRSVTPTDTCCSRRRTMPRPRAARAGGLHGSVHQRVDHQAAYGRRSAGGVQPGRRAAVPNSGRAGMSLLSWRGRPGDTAALVAHDAQFGLP